jgi:serine acetyltransferase
MNKIEQFFINRLQHYNHKKYWKMRYYIQNKEKGLKLKKVLYLYKIKKSDAFNCCSFGTSIHGGSKFKTPPILPHGPKGIIVNEFSTIGENCKIFHQVTIGEKNGKAPTIGDNVTIYPGAKIVGGITVGNNAVIGPNSVVVKDVPDNAVVSGIPAVVIKIKE